MFRAREDFTLLDAGKMLTMKKGEPFLGPEDEARRLMALGLVEKTRKRKEKADDQH